MHRSRTRPHRFTLVELLVAAVAAAVLFTALLAAMSGAWRLQERSHDRELAEAPIEAAVRRLTCELRTAVPPTGRLAGPLVATATEAGTYRHDDVSWVSATGARNPERLESDFVDVHYYLVETDDPEVFRLVRTEVRDLLATEVDEPDEVTVMDDVVSFMVTWYDGTDWVDGWDSTVQENRLPLAARVRVEFAATDTTRRPPMELIAPLVMRSPDTGGDTP